jgi:hypothetical protein
MDRLVNRCAGEKKKRGKEKRRECRKLGAPLKVPIPKNRLGDSQLFD